VRRRAFLATLASVSVAGCSSSDEPSTESGDDDWVAKFVADLEAGGVQVDSTMQMAGDLSLMYYHRPEKHEQDITRVATTFGDYAGNARSMLTVTALNPGGDSRHGGWMIEKEWAQQFAAGELSKSDYMNNVEGTFQSYE